VGLAPHGKIGFDCELVAKLTKLIRKRWQQLDAEPSRTTTAATNVQIVVTGFDTKCWDDYYYCIPRIKPATRTTTATKEVIIIYPLQGRE
jgi:hypothetical protein